MREKDQTGRMRWVIGTVISASVSLGLLLVSVILAGENRQMQTRDAMVLDHETRISKIETAMEFIGPGISDIKTMVKDIGSKIDRHIELGPQ
jgi:hypothetical protein